MALITVQRSSSNSSSILNNSDDRVTGAAASISAKNVTSITESFFVVKGAALILHKNECRVSRYLPETIHDIKQHLHAMFGIIRSQDKLSLAIRVDCSSSFVPSTPCATIMGESSPIAPATSDGRSNENGEKGHVRYVALLSTIDRFDTEEYGLIGVDIVCGTVTVGLVMPIFSDLIMKLDGNGGLKLFSNDLQYTVRPVTVQALWSIFQALNKVSKQSRTFNFYPGGISHTWMEIYRSDSVRSSDVLLNEWKLSDEVIAYRSESPVHSVANSINSFNSSDEIEFLQIIKSKLKDLMTTVDLDEVTSKYLRQQLENDLGQDLSDYGKFIDDTILRVFAHMDRSSSILDDLYLGSEWNASNYDELNDRNIGFILNVSNEIDNFFPADFHYMNVKVDDVDEAQLIREWDKTFRFIATASEHNKSCLVHCKMGISRSAATVIAFLMKKYGWNLNEAYEFVKQRRTCVRPNAGFMEQLRVYEGILKASQVKKKLFQVNTHSDKDLDVLEDSGKSEFAQTDRPLHCVLANGTEYIIKRFLESVQNYWIKRSLNIHPSQTARTLESTDPQIVEHQQNNIAVSARLTKPDQSWIRQNSNRSANSTYVQPSYLNYKDLPSVSKKLCNRSARSLLDLTNRQDPRTEIIEPFGESGVNSHKLNSNCNGTVQRRIMALERQRRIASSPFLSTRNMDHGKSENRQGFLQANRHDENSHFSRIQRLIRLYSLGLDESKLARNMSAALQRRFFDHPAPVRHQRHQIPAQISSSSCSS